MPKSEALAPKNWSIDINMTSDELWLDENFRFTVKGEERAVEIMLDSLILGAELKGIQVGGGMSVVQDE